MMSIIWRGTTLASLLTKEAESNRATEQEREREDENDSANSSRVLLHARPTGSERVTMALVLRRRLPASKARGAWTSSV
jgi:hypothetical protein